MSEYIKQLEESVQTLTDKLEAAEKGRAGALALINIMRTKYKLMRNTTDEYEYWGRTAEYDSLMKYERLSNTEAVKPEHKKIYKEARENADKDLWKDAFTQDIEKDVLDFLQVMRNELEECRRGSLKV